MAFADSLVSFLFGETDIVDIHILSVDGFYVCPEDAGDSLLVVDRKVPDAWETFQRVDLGGRRFALKGISRSVNTTSTAGASLSSRRHASIPSRAATTV